MRIWAISDLHLGFSTGKWMDKFGAQWEGHHERVELAWRSAVAEEDIVLLPGDFSWAMKPQEVAAEFAWLAALPGRKVLSKGNHDYWWPGSTKKLLELLPERIWALKKRALVLDGVPIIAVRGGDFLPRDGGDVAQVTKSLAKERHELLLSIEHLREIHDGDARPLCLFHYPPFRLDSRESAFTRILEDAGCEHCVYGHLHNPAEWERSFQGELRGVTYTLVSCDAIGFAPKLVKEL
jgi:hypothetical protein